MKDTVVLYPLPFMSHLISFVELAKIIAQNHPSFSVTIIISTPPSNPNSIQSYIKNTSNSFPSISFHSLPTIPSPPLTFSGSHLPAIFDLLHRSNPLLRQALQAISGDSNNILAFVLDFFCSTSLEIASDLNVPSYFFFTIGAASFASLIYQPVVGKDEIRNSGKLDVPGLPSIPVSDVPQIRNDRAYDHFLSLAIKAREAKGAILNTFEELEPRAVEAIRAGLCVPGAPTPPIYCIGPLTPGRVSDERPGTSECLSWLDSQPSRSVVFLCFGSFGAFSASQLREIATGLEKSWQRFLWVVRVEGENGSEDSGLGRVLPDGFLDRTSERGLVVKDWVPQIEVLSRESVGGFVTHCGWNSVLESVCAGVPMAAWPLYAEQRMNRVFLVEEMKMAVPVEESGEGLVSSDEIEKRVKQLVDSDVGRELREQTQSAREKAVAARKEGGSARVALNELAESWKRGC